MKFTKEVCVFFSEFVHDCSKALIIHPIAWSLHGSESYVGIGW